LLLTGKVTVLAKIVTISVIFAVFDENSDVFGHFRTLFRALEKSDSGSTLKHAKFSRFHAILPIL
jgi:hypothetical protein